MFGEVYKIKEDAIPQLAIKTRNKKITTMVISFGLLFIFFAYALYPLIEKDGPGYLLYFIVPIFMCMYLSLRLRKTINIRNQLSAYEITISDSGIQCCYMINKSKRNITIGLSEISKISYYLKNSILIIGKDLGHSISIPYQIEKRDEIIAKLRAISPIQDGKKEIRIYYWQRINIVFFFVGALMILATTSKLWLVLACISILYSISLPVYFFITSRNLPSHVKLSNGIYVTLGLLLIAIGIIIICQH